MSQGIHNLCGKPLVKIAKINENDRVPFTSCVTPDVAERFKELGWRVVPPNSNVLAIMAREAAEDETVLEAAEEVIEEVGDVGEAIEELAEEVVESVEETTEEISETVEEAVEEIGETIEEAAEEVSETVEEAAEELTE